MARVSVFFFFFFFLFFFQRSPSPKKKCFLFVGVKVREDWLVYVNLFYKESKFKKYIYIFFFTGGWGN